MEFEFTGRHVEITPTIEKLVRKELAKVDRILDSAAMRAHVILSSEKHRKSAEIVLYWRDNVFAGLAENNELNQSITSATSKVYKQALRLKEKLKTNKRQRVAAKAIAPVPGGTIEAGPGAPRIIPARRYRIKPMTLEEAASSVEDSPDQFLVFRDAETSKVAVLYKRKDGNFGLIEP
ncbi:MAG TPA: ribosome-associated translation inhibitor RaiA [Blastocatellia bacterium]|nr:ribosome-associated translation inhibitor RaiA [Blastocatellia bacterium]